MANPIYAQIDTLEGHVMSQFDKRPVIGAKISVTDKYTGDTFFEVESDKYGNYIIPVPISKRILINFQSSPEHKGISFPQELWSTGQIRLDTFVLQDDKPIVNRFEYKLTVSPSEAEELYFVVNSKSENLNYTDTFHMHSKNHQTLELREGEVYEMKIFGQGVFPMFYRIVIEGNSKARIEYLSKYDAPILSSSNLYIDTLSNTIYHQPALKKCTINATMVIEDIHFPGQSTVLSEQNASMLNDILDFLELNRNVILELGYIELSDRESEHNLETDELRAQIMVDYLLERRNLPGLSLSPISLKPEQFLLSKYGASISNSGIVENGSSRAYTRLKILGFLGSEVEAPTMTSKEMQSARYPLIPVTDISETSQEHKDSVITKQKAIQIMYTSKPLPKGHRILDMTGLIIEEKQNGGYAYLVGCSESDNALTTKLYDLRKEYKDAFIVSFENGTRKLN